jgi:hypothetical protein
VTAVRVRHCGSVLPLSERGTFTGRPSACREVTLYQAACGYSWPNGTAYGVALQKTVLRTERWESLTCHSINITGLWDVTPCGLVIITARSAGSSGHQSPPRQTVDN